MSEPLILMSRVYWSPLADDCKPPRKGFYLVATRRNPEGRALYWDGESFPVLASDLWWAEIPSLPSCQEMQS